MNDTYLQTRRCKPCESGTESLGTNRIAEMLEDVPGWQTEETGPGIAREFRFPDYSTTLAFANAVAWVAQRENHHPILEIHFNHCVVRYHTHAIGGLSENDFICAAKVSALYDP